MCIRWMLVVCLIGQALVTITDEPSLAFRRVCEACLQEMKKESREPWINTYTCLIGADIEAFAYMSSNQACVYRKGIFGLDNELVFPIETDKDVLNCQIEDSMRVYPCLAKRMVVVKADRRTFIVPIGELHGFCLDFSQKRTLDSYLHTAQDKQNPSNIVLPESLNELINAPAIVAMIKSVQIDETDFELRFEVGIESQTYICNGMLFLDESMNVFEIVEKEDTLAVAKIWTQEALNFDKAKELLGRKIYTFRKGIYLPNNGASQ